MPIMGCLYRPITDSEYHDHIRKFHERRQRAVIQARMNGKENFNFARFVELYSHDTGNCEKLRADAPSEVQNYYRSLYYDYPDIRTVRDFAQFLDHIEATA